jgi:hypothetical protein
MGYLSDALPPTLDKLLNDNIDAKDYFANMDDAGKSELINYANEFKSKEELERYVYYLTDDSFR